jgi:hypothetical protein
MELSRPFQREFHTFSASPPYADLAMRRAFVVHLGPGTEPRQRHFDGWIEEVDTGREARFHSTEGLLTFLSECVDRARRRESEAGHEEEDSSRDGS